MLYSVHVVALPDRSRLQLLSSSWCALYDPTRQYYHECSKKGSPFHLSVFRRVPSLNYSWLVFSCWVAESARPLGIASPHIEEMASHSGDEFFTDGHNIYYDLETLERQMAQTAEEHYDEDDEAIDGDEEFVTEAVAPPERE